MIGKLKGIVDAIADDYMIVDCNGVGYIAFCSSRTISKSAVGEAIALYIETHVREDHIHLYGFASEAEKQWFKILLNVQGVGAKVGLAILSFATPTEIMQAVAAQDKSFFAKVPGIGPKLAQRIVTELKDKVAKLPIAFTVNSPQAVSANNSPAANSSQEGGVVSDAVSALANLGIARMDAFVAVNKVANDDMRLEDVINAALKEVSR